MLIWISLSDQVVNVSSDLQARRLSQANTQAHRQLGKDAHTHDFHNNHKPLNHNLLFIIWYCERIPLDWTPVIYDIYRKLSDAGREMTSTC